MAEATSARERYRATENDRVLIEEFKNNPIGHHSPELQQLLNLLRGTPMADKFCLVTLKPNREWQLAKTTGVPGQPLKMMSRRFTSLAEAEWYVFRQRWKQMTGESLPA